MAGSFFKFLTSVSIQGEKLRTVKQHNVFTLAF
jgi:hypothetical protein